MQDPRQDSSDDTPDNSEVLSDDQEHWAEVGMDEDGNWSGPPPDTEVP